MFVDAEKIAGNFKVFPPRRFEDLSINFFASLCN